MNVEYYWKIQFIDGTYLTQIENNQLDKKDKIDPQNPSKQAVSIELISVNSKFMPVFIRIPPNAKPVCHRLITRDREMKLTGLSYRVGWSLNGTRVMSVINVKTNIISIEVDNKGIK